MNLQFGLQAKKTRLGEWLREPRLMRQTPGISKESKFSMLTLIGIDKCHLHSSIPNKRSTPHSGTPRID